MTATKIFNPKGWLIGFAILHAVLFLIPQLFATSATASMNWGDGNVPAHAEFYELQMGVLGIGYTPILIAIAVLTEGALRAKLALVTGLSMGVIGGLNTYINIQKAGYMEDMPLAFMIGMPLIVFGGLTLSGWLNLNDGE